MKKGNRRLKYVFTAALLVLCTAAVVFAPSVYYTASDNAMKKDVHMTELGIPKKNIVLTSEEVVELFRSDDLIKLTIETDALTESKVRKIVTESLPKMINGYDENTPIYRAFDYVITNIDDFVVWERSPVSLIGEIDGEPVSLTYIVTSLELNNETGFSNVNLYIDYNTSKIHYANLTVPADVAGYNGKDVDFMENNHIEEFRKHLARYWELPEENIVIHEFNYDIDYGLSMDFVSTNHISEEEIGEYDEASGESIYTIYN